MASDPEASTHEQLINLDEACEMFGGDRELLRSIVEAFLIETPGLLKTIESSLELGDDKAVLRAAHTMKSNFNNLCQHDTAQLCREVEDFAKQAKLPEIQERFGPLKDRVQNTIDQLNAYLAS
jgi:HPt (histidine-containing phosphotransfer) domain-containing protein